MSSCKQKTGAAVVGEVIVLWVMCCVLCDACCFTGILLCFGNPVRRGRRVGLPHCNHQSIIKILKICVPLYSHYRCRRCWCFHQKLPAKAFPTISHFHIYHVLSYFIITILKICVPLYSHYRCRRCRCFHQKLPAKVFPTILHLSHFIIFLSTPS